MLWYSKAPTSLQGLQVYQPNGSEPDDVLSIEVQRMLANENLPHYKSCRIFFNFRESLLVPAHLKNNSSPAAFLDLLYGEDASAAVAQEAVPSLDAVHYYRVPALLKNSLSDRFFGASIQHSNSCQLMAARDFDLYCIIYPASVKLIVHKAGVLQLQQTYPYKAPADVSYYLLQACEQHGIAPAEASLCLSGFIDQDSHLYQEIYRYFLSIQLLPIPAEVTLSEAMESLPPQFYSFLIPLLQCEL